MVNAKGQRTLLKEKVFSVLVAVEENTKWINSKGNTIHLRKGSLLIWRGDYRHAGAPHKREQSRIFIEISHPIHNEIDEDRVANIRVRK